jgi:hypothetical protein
MKASATTEAEQDLLDFARRALGNNLAGFLLSGSADASHLRRSFTVQRAGVVGHITTYKLEIISENGQGLPAGRDPLVMAALLHRLWTGERGQDEVVFRDEALLERLSWADTPESRHSIGGAIERYYSTAYLRTSTVPLGAGGGEWRSSNVQKLITGYETTVERLVSPPKEVRKSTIVQFTPKLVEEMTGPEKYFLGIDFERLGSLEPLEDVGKA